MSYKKVLADHMPLLHSDPIRNTLTYLGMKIGKNLAIDSLSYNVFQHRYTQTNTPLRITIGDNVTIRGLQEIDMQYAKDSDENIAIGDNCYVDVAKLGHAVIIGDGCELNDIRFISPRTSITNTIIRPNLRDNRIAPDWQGIGMYNTRAYRGIRESFSNISIYTWHLAKDMIYSFNNVHIGSKVELRGIRQKDFVCTNDGLSLIIIDQDCNYPGNMSAKTTALHKLLEMTGNENGLFGYRINKAGIHVIKADKEPTTQEELLHNTRVDNNLTDQFGKFTFIYDAMAYVEKNFHDIHSDFYDLFSSTITSELKRAEESSHKFVRWAANQLRWNTASYFKNPSDLLKSLIK